MLLTNLERVEGKKIECLGLATGTVILSTLGSNVRNPFLAQVERLQEARKNALDKLVSDAEAKNADCVLGINFTFTQIGNSMAEIFVYGTAAKYIE
jgi:uncharacterized protein YbjQ (UPF0145 family)